MDLVDRSFDSGDRLWVADVERHEVFANRAVVEEHNRDLCARSALKLRAA